MAIEKNFYQDFIERRENKYKPITAKNTVDNSSSVMYNKDKKNTGTITPSTDFSKQWKEKNQGLFKYAGDCAKDSVDKGLKEAHDYMQDADKGTSFEDVQTASVKRHLSNDANDDKLYNAAMMELIGHLSKDNKETYLKHAQPLQKYIDAKDEFDFKHNNYTTTENVDTTPDENVRQLQRELNEAGYTDKMGQPIKDDGVYAGKTAYADDSMKADNPNKTNYSTTQSTKNQFSAKDLSKEDIEKIGKYVYGDDYDPDVLALSFTDNGMVEMPQKIAGLSGYLEPVYESVDDILNGVQNTANKIKIEAKAVANKVNKALETLTSKVTWKSLFSASEQGVGVVDLKDGYLLSKKADERAIKYAEETNSEYDETGKVITWGNEADAYRHFTWNYEMASKLGYSTALKISSAHEIAFLRVHELFFMQIQAINMIEEHL